ncbi:MAG: type II 3-dehydroquinate dehydratase [Acidimicrobiales bacterium]
MTARTPGSRPVLILSGPNLNLLGERQPEVYGRETLDDHVRAATEEGRLLGLAIEHRWSNDEGELVGAVHAARGRFDALVVNAGAFSHTSWSLHDALAAFDGVVVELHLSNPAAREPFRHRSVLASVSDGTIAGFGGLGYNLAMTAVARLLDAGGSRGAQPSRVGAPGAGDSGAVPGGDTS